MSPRGSSPPRTPQTPTANPGPDTPHPRNRKEMSDLVTSAVETVIRPVTTRIDELCTQNAELLRRVPPADELQNQFKKLATQIGSRASKEDVNELRTRLDDVKERLVDVANMVNVGLDTTHAIQGKLEEVQCRVLRVNEQTANALVVSCQAYNRGRGETPRRPFRIVPFALDDNRTQSPVEGPFHLTPLYTLRAIEDLLPEELDTYLYRYGINHDGLTHQQKVEQLKAHIGYMPRDDHAGVIIIMLVALLFLLVILHSGSRLFDDFFWML